MVVRFRLAEWLVYPLAGYPHLLFSLWVSAAALAAGFGVLGSAWRRLTLIYGLVLGFGLLLGLARRLPRWSASWVGYGLLFGLNWLVGWPVGDRLTSGPMAWIAGLLWLGLAMLVLSLLARHDRVEAVLAALPIAPMFGWALVLGQVPDIPLRVLLLGLAGLLLGVLAVVLAHMQRPGLAVPLVALPVAGFSLLVSMAVSFAWIWPWRIESLAGLMVRLTGWLASLAGSELALLGSVALFTAPAWLGWVLSRLRLS